MNASSDCSATRSRGKTWAVSTAAVAGLWALGVAQPLFSVIGHAPEFVVAHRLDRFDVYVFTSVVLLLPALAAGAVVGVAALVGRRTANAVTALLIGTLIAVFAAQVGYRLGASTWRAASLLGLVTAAAGCVAWLTLRAFRTFVMVMALASVAVPVVFLSSESIRAAVRDDSSPPARLRPSQDPPVVLIVFDELPLLTLLDEKGGLDAKRYPNIAALAADGIWFPRATTVSDYTQWALPAILSGRFPTAASVPTSSNHPHTLFSLLASTHHMRAVEPLTALCPASLCGGNRDPFRERLEGVFDDVGILAAHIVLPPEARSALPDLAQGWKGLDAVPDQFSGGWKRTMGQDHQSTAMQFVDGVSGSDPQPTLYFMHSLVTHHPPRWLASGQGITEFAPPPGILTGPVWTKHEWPVVGYQQGHLVQAGLADAVIGRLLTRLREAGLYDRALVVVTADHGMAFRAGDEVRDFRTSNAGEILPIPLIFKLPSHKQVRPKGTVDDRNIEAIDILPTIADALGVELPWPVDGASALREGSARPDKRIYYRNATQQAVVRPEEIARLLDEANTRKARVFGTDLWPSPSPAGLGRLLGQTVASLPVDDAPGGLSLEVAPMPALTNVNLAGPTLPVLVSGRVVSAGGFAPAEVRLAIALNGVIVATSRTWSETAEFRALMPPGALRQGRNDLDVFIVDPARPGRLQRTTRDSPAPPLGTDLLFGDLDGFGMSWEGFHHVEHAGDRPFHWTDGNASIRVSIDPHRRPAKLSVDLLFAAKAGMQLRILLDDCEVASEAQPGGRWSKDIDVSACVPPGGWTVIRFLSETVQPGNGDRRRLGVALARVALQ